MHVLIEKLAPAAALLTRSGSARNGRACARARGGGEEEEKTASQLLSSPTARRARVVRRAREGPRHRDEVRVAAREDPLRDLGAVDAVRRAQRDVAAHAAAALERGRAQLARDPRVRAARHARRDRRHARLVPADPRVDHVDPRVVERARERDDLVPARAALDEVEHREAEDERKVGPALGARRPHDVEREPAPVLVAPAVLVVAVVRARGEELVDEVALRAHDLDAVVARLARERGARGEVVDGRAHVGRRERARREPADRRLLRARRDREGVVRVPPGVQQLHRDERAVRVHRVGHGTVLARLRARRHLARERRRAARGVGRDAARHDEPDAALRTPREVRGELLLVAALLEPAVHRAHDHAVAQHVPRAQRERREHVRVRRRRLAGGLGRERAATERAAERPHFQSSTW